MSKLNLTIDLKNNVVPISKASAAIAALLRRSKETGTPIIITQKGYPTGALLDIDVYLELLSQVGLAELAAKYAAEEA